MKVLSRCVSSFNHQHKVLICISHFCHLKLDRVTFVKKKLIKVTFVNWILAAACDIKLGGIPALAADSDIRPTVFM